MTKVEISREVYEEIKAAGAHHLVDMEAKYFLTVKPNSRPNNTVRRKKKHRSPNQKLKFVMNHRHRADSPGRQAAFVGIAKAVGNSEVRAGRRYRDLIAEHRKCSKSSAGHLVRELIDRGILVPVE